MAMSGTNNPTDSDAVQDTWETGMRRRRGRGNSTGNEDDDNNDESSPRAREGRRRPNGHNSNSNGSSRAIQGNNSRDFDGTPGPSNSRGNFAATGMGAASGPCSGNGGGAVGVVTSPAGGATSTFGGGAAPSTPYKTPTRDNGLVAVTPSSITTSGETVESTLFSHSPLSIRRRRSSHRGQRPSASAPSLRRQYQLLRSQIILLLGSAIVGLVLFLFYALPLAAFISLVLMCLSMGALVPVAGSVLRARYEMEMEHPLGLTRYLPESMRVMLTETTLHEFMTDTTFMMENRYMLLYFMPGLTPEQLMNFIDQLPPRHRDALLQPGLGRLMPSVMENLMRMDANGGAGTAGGGTPLLGNGDNVSVASGLTMDRDHHGENGEHDGDDAEVTLLEAVTGLRRTLAGFALDNGAPDAGNGVPAQPVQMPACPPVAVQTQLLVENASLTIEENHDNIQDDDNSSFDFSIDLDTQGLTDMVADANEAPATPSGAASTPTDNPELRNVIFELPQSSELGDANQQLDDQNREEEVQQDYDLEGRILSEAASAAVANYTAQASAIARDTASETLDTTSSWLIRAGSLTGLIAGSGGIVAAVFANPQVVGSNFPRSVTLGIMGGSIGNTGTASSPSGGADGGSSGSANNGASDRSGYPSFVYGLLYTSAFGFVGAGVAYLARNQVRASIREKRLKEDAEREDDKPSSGSE